MVSIVYSHIVVLLIRYDFIYNGFRLFTFQLVYSPRSKQHSGNYFNNR